MSNLKTRQKINSQPITRGVKNAGFQADLATLGP